MRFLVDAMLGRLARYLRMAGHDAAYTLDLGLESDAEIARYAEETGRRVVTRDTDLAVRRPDAILLESRDVDAQLAGIRDAGVGLRLTTPARCGRCNGELDRLDADAPRPAYAPADPGTPVWRCRDCGQCFWRGSHWDDVAARLDAG